MHVIAVLVFFNTDDLMRVKLHVCDVEVSAGLATRISKWGLATHNLFKIDIFSSKTLKMLKYNFCHSFNFDH